MIIPNKRELQQIALNLSISITSLDLMEFFQEIVYLE